MEAGWGIRRSPSQALLRVVREAGSCRKLVWEGYLLWGRVAVAVLGSTQPGLPWGLFALREERQQRASASMGQGRAAESCCHGYGVLHGEAPWAF